MTDTVFRQVTEDIWTFSKPFSQYGFVPVGGRTTVIRLADGGLWIIASTPLTEDTKTMINQLGPVRYLISPNALHYLFISDYQKEYPYAKVFGSADAAQKIPKVDFTGVWGRDPAGTTYEFENEVQAVYFPGIKNKDICFFHVASKTLLEGDLLFNLPATEQYSLTKGGKFLGSSGLNPHSWLHHRFIKGLILDKQQMGRDARAVAKWDFQRIIPCHGDVIETGAKEAWLAAYKQVLEK